jgi:cytochrome c biogenesis protein CcdA
VTHLGFIAGAYALGMGLPIVYAVAAYTRARSAKRRLAAVETRRG